MTQLACLYLPDFPAWALACRWSSRSKSTGIVVCDAGRVLCFSHHLSAAGLRAGDPLDRARNLVPNAEFHLRDPEVERAAWENLLCRMYQLTPRVQSITPSESSPTGKDSAECGAWALMQAPDHDGLQTLAGELDARVGIASHRPWAVLAAAYSEPRQLTSIPAHMTKPFLLQAHVSLLRCAGFCADMVDRLLLFGLKAIAHVADLTDRHLNAQFGDEGSRLFRFLHPPPDEPQIPNYDPQVLDAEYDFDLPAFEPAQLEPVVPHLIERLILLLKEKRARHIELRLKEHPGGSGKDGRQPRAERRAGRIFKDPTAQPERLCTAARYLLRQTLGEGDRTASRMGSSVPPIAAGIDTLSITLGGLTDSRSVQTDLFARKPSLGPLVKSMDQRFPGRLLRPVLTHADPFFPEESYRFEPVCP